jgi:hypothetical protein
VVIVKKISGTIDTNNKFKKISPNGFKTLASSLKIRPIMVPTSTLKTRMRVDL